MLRMKSERTLDMKEELCACSIDRQKVSDTVIWKKKLMKILKGNDIDWCEKD
jgi:hypothetical protein